MLRYRLSNKNARSVLGQSLLFISELITLIILCLYANGNVYAFSCPSPEEIRERKISRDFEWTVNDDTSLDDMLSVTRLIAISIENQLEYVSCKYKIDSKFIKLDGKPVSENCSISISSGSWLTHGNRKICSEKELDQCLFDIDC